MGGGGRPSKGDNSCQLNSVLSVLRSGSGGITGVRVKLNSNQAIYNQKNQPAKLVI